MRAIVFVVSKSASTRSAHLAAGTKLCHVPLRALRAFDGFTHDRSAARATTAVAHLRAKAQELAKS
jgi:hypothetical protein